MRAIILLLAGLAALPALADELVATKPGVMCASAQALAELTLPSGDSRTHAPNPAAADVALAAAGGCVDIKPGTRATVLEAYRNTTVATVDGVRLTIPNADFQPATAGGASAQAGYTVASRVAVNGLGGPFAVEVLEDARISASLRKQMWNVSDDPSFVLPDSPLAAEFTRRPPLGARVRLMDAGGTVMAEQLLERPLATVALAPLHGLPSQPVWLTVDYSIGMGSYAGPITTLLLPANQKLDPVTYAGPHGQSGAVQLTSTLKTAWRTVPGRAGGTEELEEIACRPNDGDDFTTSLSTYRYVGGAWQLAVRKRAGFWEADEVFPPRSAFP